MNKGGMCRLAGGWLRGIFLAAVLCVLAMTAAPAEAAWQPTLAVGLMNGQTIVSLATRQGEAELLLDGKVRRMLSSGATLTVAVSQDEFLVNGKKMTGNTLSIRPAAKGEVLLAVNGRPYRGSLRLIRRDGHFTVVNDVLTEDYLKSVLPGEMPPKWPLEARKAQAIAARSFALANRGRHQADGYDLCATTHCQTYTGVQAEREAGTAAVDATYGQVMTYQGHLLDAVFHTDSGGMTENSEDVWGTRIPYLRAVPELQKATQPWRREWDVAAFSAKIDRKGRLGKLKSIRLSPLRIGRGASDRAASGRVKDVVLIGDRGTLHLSGNELRSLFQLKSTLFDLKLSGNHVVATGYGAGHGLGLSQWGARAYAAKGVQGENILAHYYQGMQLKVLYKK